MLYLYQSYKAFFMVFIDSLGENGVTQMSPNTLSDYLVIFFQHLWILECFNSMELKSH